MARRRFQTVGACVGALALVGIFAPVAFCKNLANLRVDFTPDRPGVSTTIVIRYELGSTDGRVPSPVTDINLRLPAGLEGTTNLGDAICKTTMLQSQGVGGCPQNAKMGGGEALVAVPIGPAIVYEPVTITAFMGQPEDGHTVMLFYAQGDSPVDADLVFPGQLISDYGQFGEQINTVVPVTPSLPDGPDVSLVRMESEIGANHILYKRDVRGKTVLFRPEGPVIPRYCPRGGFPFAAEISFQDGSHVIATSHVPCTHDNRSK
jgi:hypothetical protein